MRTLLFILTVLISLFTSPGFSASAQESANQKSATTGASVRVEIVIFWQPGCPYCAQAKEFLNGLDVNTYDWLDVVSFDITSSRSGQKLFTQTNDYFGILSPSVPLIVVGGEPFIGYDGDQTTGKEILQEAQACRKSTCPTLVQTLAQSPAGEQRAKANEPDVPDTLDLPLIGKLDISSLSLPALTIVLAAIDGFNPCALWVLVFLIGLLLGMQDRVRMWLLGGAFLLTSGVVYFGFLAAWLNLFLLLGAILWVRLAVGAVAIGSGGWYLWEFARNSAAECKVTNPAQRQRIMQAFRASVNEKRFLVAVAGVVVLAVTVNAIELFCSAGIPAVYTQVLSISMLPAWQHYAYLLLYTVIFILDDIAIFTIAMFTLSATGMTTQYLRISHLLGGVIMVGIGLMLIFAPGWLAFTV